MMVPNTTDKSTIKVNSMEKVKSITSMEIISKVPLLMETVPSQSSNERTEASTKDK